MTPKPFTMANTVRMYDTDTAGILYFGQQFRFANDALESMMHHCGFSFYTMFKEGQFGIVVVHAEADYKASLHVGDQLLVHTQVTHIGTTSFALSYDIMKGDLLAGTVKTVHVAIDIATRNKIPIPSAILSCLEQFKV